MKRIVSIITLLTGLVTLSGCANFRAEYLGSRITCTVAKDKAYVTSIWGLIGISSEIVKEDAEVICGTEQINGVK